MQPNSALKPKCPRCAGFAVMSLAAAVGLLAVLGAAVSDPMRYKHSLTYPKHQGLKHIQVGSLDRG